MYARICARNLAETSTRFALVKESPRPKVFPRPKAIPATRRLALFDARTTPYD